MWSNPVHSPLDPEKVPVPALVLYQTQNLTYLVLIHRQCTYHLGLLESGLVLNWNQDFDLRLDLLGSVQDLGHNLVPLDLEKVPAHGRSRDGILITEVTKITW